MAEMVALGKIMRWGALCALMAGCAQSPESIMPAYVSDIGYQGLSCQQLAEEHSRLSAALMTASVQQENARSNDIAGIILIGLPVSSLSGANVAPLIARYRGEIEAVQRTMIRKPCRPDSGHAVSSR
jgi:hypothetical protein